MFMFPNVHFQSFSFANNTFDKVRRTISAYNYTWYNNVIAEPK